MKENKKLNWISMRSPVPIIRVRIATLINKNSNFLLQTGSYTLDCTLQKQKQFDSIVSISTEKKGLSSEECARQCAPDETNDCYHFESCETMETAGQRPTRYCRFTSGSPNPETAVNDTCKVYSIKSKTLPDPETNSVTVNPEIPTETPTKTENPVPEPDPIPDNGTTPSKKPSNGSGGVSTTITVILSLLFVCLITIGGVFGFRYFKKWRANRVEDKSNFALQTIRGHG